MSKGKFKRVYHAITRDGRAVDVWFKEGSQSKYAQALVATNFLSLCFDRINSEWELATRNDKTFIYFDVMPVIEPLYQLYINDIISGDLNADDDSN